jgi:hypothetical protein
VPAGLLLPVAADPQVDRQRVLLRELLGRLQKQIQLALVIGDPAREDVLPANGRLEGVGFPELERRRRLNVEVAVADHRRGVSAPVRGPELAERERVAVPVPKLGFAPGPADKVADPFARGLDVGRALGVGADAGDADELRELVEPGLFHGAGV